jgi:hypothetical protein
MRIQVYIARDLRWHSPMMRSILHGCGKGAISSVASQLSLPNTRMYNITEVSTLRQFIK